MSRSISVHFKIPISHIWLQRIATLLNIEIIEIVNATKYIHTIPQQQIDAWDSARHEQDHVADIQSQAGFHIRKHLRSGSIYYVDGAGKVCEFYYEFSGIPQYDILIAASAVREWFFPAREKFSAAAKNEIVEKLGKWLAESKINAHLYSVGPLQLFRS